jgi:hypothetical protein
VSARNAQLQRLSSDIAGRTVESGRLEAGLGDALRRKADADFEAAERRLERCGARHWPLASVRLPDFALPPPPPPEWPGKATYSPLAPFVLHSTIHSTKRALADAEADLGAARSTLAGTNAELGTASAALRQADAALAARRAELSGLAHCREAAAADGFAEAKHALLEEGGWRLALGLRKRGWRLSASPPPVS